MMYVVKQDMICLRRGLASLTQEWAVVEDEAHGARTDLRSRVRDLEIGQPNNSEKCSETADGVARESEGGMFNKPAPLGQ
jgi:hypothetical protein